MWRIFLGKSSSFRRWPHGHKWIGFYFVKWISARECRANEASGQTWSVVKWSTLWATRQHIVRGDHRQRGEYAIAYIRRATQAQTSSCAHTYDHARHSTYIPPSFFIFSNSIHIYARIFRYISYRIHQRLVVLILSVIAAAAAISYINSYSAAASFNHPPSLPSTKVRPLGYLFPTLDALRLAGLHTQGIACDINIFIS